jgi:hypothetical protein
VTELPTREDGTGSPPPTRPGGRTWALAACFVRYGSATDRDRSGRPCRRRVPDKAGGASAMLLLLSASARCGAAGAELGPQPSPARVAHGGLAEAAIKLWLSSSTRPGSANERTNGPDQRHAQAVPEHSSVVGQRQFGFCLPLERLRLDGVAARRLMPADQGRHVGPGVASCYYQNSFRVDERGVIPLGPRCPASRRRRLDDSVGACAAWFSSSAALSSMLPTGTTLRFVYD